MTFVYNHILHACLAAVGLQKTLSDAHPTIRPSSSTIAKKWVLSDATAFRSIIVGTTVLGANSCINIWMSYIHLFVRSCNSTIPISFS